jgi:hypothetical protein
MGSDIRLPGKPDTEESRQSGSDRLAALKAMLASG